MDERVVLPVDTVLDGSYRIVRVVGSGGFGITYEAVDIKLQAKIAIKEYYPYDFGHRDVATMRVTPKSERHKETFDWGRANFLLEARTLARFEHPSIVRVSRVYEANSTAYMIMRFEQGQSFENWLRELDRPPTQDELDAIVAPLLDALEVMHAENFLHRDIAPDNIIVRADGTPVLLDFGSARRAVAERSRVLTGIVKAGYSPNEQYASDSRLQGPWSDIYALGGTLYRAVTGRIPEEATLRVTDDRTPAAASIVKGKYRPGFLAAIDVSLKVRPADRPQSVAKLRPMLFKPAPQPKRVTERRVEVPAVAKSGNRTLVIAAILVVLGGALGGVGYARWRSTDQLQSEAEIKRKADREAKQQADAAAVKARADEEALAKAQVEARRKADLAEQETRQRAEAAAAKKRADDEEAAKAKTQTQAEARRQAELAEQEARRQAEAAAAQKRADDEAAAKARADDEARRLAELAGRERRRQEASLAIASFDGVWEIRRVGGCFSGPPVFGVTIANGMFAQGFGTVSPAGEFKLLGRSQNTGPRDLRYTGTLVGASGSGTFQIEGGTCSGTFTAKRR